MVYAASNTSRVSRQLPHNKELHPTAYSIVALVIATMLCALLVVMAKFESLIPLIAAVGRVSVAVWRSIPRTIDTNSIPIGYFPA
ncbi:hypothetical protein [Chamaesiphon sp.]|uniref:hypothetical protein n=1 Tax=Chamaesiphon sp. TaxID=2814140 RepID=UPI0035941487